MNKDKTVGVAIDKHGDLQNLFNNGGPKGAAANIVATAIAHGARTLDCYDGYLPDYYRNFGFREPAASSSIQSLHMIGRAAPTLFSWRGMVTLIVPVMRSPEQKDRATIG
jgi:hypothetical protein